MRFRGSVLRPGLVVLAALYVFSPLQAATPEVTAVRSVELDDGSCLRVATRYRDAVYRPGAPIAIDPVLGDCPGTAPAERRIRLGRVELRAPGFAPCLASSPVDHDRAECVAGSAPVMAREGSPARFSFSFDRLFRTGPADPEQATDDTAFGYASFLVTLHLTTAGSADAVVRFPLTVLVHQDREDSSGRPPGGTLLVRRATPSGAGGWETLADPLSALSLAPPSP